VSRAARPPGNRLPAAASRRLRRRWACRPWRVPTPINGPLHPGFSCRRSDPGAGSGVPGALAGGALSRRYARSRRSRAGAMPERELPIDPRPGAGFQADPPSRAPGR
jgi:hypothetical protein